MSENWWWIYLVIAVAGWLATDIWRWMGVLIGNRLDEDSEGLQWVRAVATALVMAVTAKLVVFPTGTIADAPLWLRAGSVAAGFVAFLLAGQRVVVCVVVALAVLVTGLLTL